MVNQIASKGEKMKNKKEDKRGENIFVGCMFIGIGLGFLFEHMPAGTMIGMGVGCIAQQLYSKSSN